jgi:peptidoglycan-N-acetylglucosamine deacetylase
MKRILIVTAVLVIFCSLQESVSSIMDISPPIMHGSREEMLLAPTFDDGPDNKTTSEVLDILDLYNAKATFCSSGEHARKNPELIREIVARGHELCDHAQTNPKLADCNTTRQTEEISNCSKELESISGKKISLFRPPFLNYDFRTLEIAHRLGMKVIFADVDAEDYNSSNLTVEQIVQKCLQQAQNGSFLIFHDSWEKGGPSVKTVKALTAILETLSQRGFRFVTASELLASR